MISVSKSKKGDNLIEELTEKTKKGIISYPFTYYFSKPPQELFNNLKNYKPLINNERYDSILGVKMDYKKFPTTFNGKYITIIHRNEEYLNMDIITNYFTQDERIKCSVRGYPSPYQYWMENNEKIYRYIIENKMPLTPYTLSEFMYGRMKECTLFKVSLVKAVLELLGNPKRVLDFSAGWGDRLIGCASNGVLEYTGFDPNISLKKGHSKIIKMFGTKKYKVIYKPFEEADTKNIKVDLVFTSPPYFDFEEYSKLKTQSMKKFNEYEKWLNGFLFVALEKSWNCLVAGGYMAIHIQDTKTMPELCQRMNTYIKTKLKNSKYIGIISSSGASKIRRPIWVWKKVL